MANLMHFGGFLRKLTGNADAGDVKAGKTFYKDDAKTKITGTLATVTNDGTHIDFNGATGHMTNESGSWQLTLHDNDGVLKNKCVPSSNFWLRFPGSLFGSATQAQVLKDKEFTSTAGLKLKGTMANNGPIGTTTLDAGGSKSFSAGYYDTAGSVSARRPYDYDTVASADWNYTVTGLTVGAWYAFAIHSIYSSAWVSSGLTDTRSSSCGTYEIKDSDGTVKGGGNLTLITGKATNTSVTFATTNSAAGSRILCRRIG